MKKTKPYFEFGISQKEIIDHLLTSSSISKDEWKFLLKYSKKAGFVNLKDYLNYFLEDIFQSGKSIFETVLKKKIDKAKNILELTLPSINNIDSTILNVNISKRQISVNNKVEKFPSEVQEKIINLELRFEKIIMSLNISYLSNEPVKQTLIIDLWKKYYMQLMHLSDKREIAKDFLEYIDSIDPSVLRTYIQQKDIKLEYFNDKVHILQEIHNKLVEQKLIIKNENFLISFTKERKKEHFTSWLGTLPELIYLLYRLNNESIKIKNIFLYNIAEQLFNYKEKPFAYDSLRAAFNRIASKLNDQIFISKKLKRIKNLFD